MSIVQFLLLLLSRLHYQAIQYYDQFQTQTLRWNHLLASLWLQEFRDPGLGCPSRLLVPIVQLLLLLLSRLHYQAIQDCDQFQTQTLRWNMPSLSLPHPSARPSLFLSLCLPPRPPSLASLRASSDYFPLSTSLHFRAPCLLMQSRAFEPPLWLAQLLPLLPFARQASLLVRLSSFLQ